MRMVPDVTDCSHWEFCGTAVLFLSPKQRVWTATQEEMRYKDSPVNAPPAFKKKNDAATPLQNSYS